MYLLLKLLKLASRFILTYIYNEYFEQIIDIIYPNQLQLNKTNTSDTEVRFLDLRPLIFHGIISTTIYDKRDDFDFNIANFLFLVGDVPRAKVYRNQNFTVT